MLSFPGQREDESVLDFVNKHWIVYTKIVLSFTLVVVVPLIAFLLFWFIAYPIEEYPARGYMIGIVACIYLLFSLLFICIRWINEEFDVFILTTDRLIDVTQITFLKRTVTATPLEQIQDTTGTMNGFVGTILNYGDLEVQTAAGDASEFFIDHIPDPEFIAQQILDLVHRKRRGEDLHLHRNVYRNTLHKNN